MLTTFLASLWGPAILAIGIGFVTSPKYYKRLYRDLENESLSLLVLSMLLIPIGIAQITFHNSWDTLATGLISFLGWATLAKGIALAVFPKMVDRAADYEVKNGFLPIAGIIMLVIGAYLTWIAFF